MQNAIRMICVLLLFLETAPAAGRIKRVAVLEFENAGPDKSLDWIGTWLEEEITQEAKRAPALTIVDRGILDAILREFKLARSQYISPTKPHRTSKRFACMRFPLPTTACGGALIFPLSRAALP